MKKTYIIAEIGINHNGDLDIAKRLIDIAALSDCDAVKFQKRNPDVCVPEHQKNVMRDTPWGTMTYLEYKYKVEFGKTEYDEIDRYCKEKGIAWSASPWDLDSLEFLNQYDLPFIKLPSAMLTNYELIEACAKSGKRVILSTGMSTEEEIDTAVNTIKCFTSNFAILHCNSTYPAPLNELNLSTIKTLKDKYDCELYKGAKGVLNKGSYNAGAINDTIIINASKLDKYAIRVFSAPTLYSDNQCYSILIDIY